MWTKESLQAEFPGSFVTGAPVVLLIGDQRTGKTTIVHRISKRCREHRGYSPTQDITVTAVRIDHPEHGERTLNVIELGGHPINRNQIWTGVIEVADFVVVVEATYNETRLWSNVTGDNLNEKKVWDMVIERLEECPDNRRPMIVTCLNQGSSRPDKFRVRDMKRFSDACSLRVWRAFVINARENEEIAEMFMAIVEKVFTFPSLLDLSARVIKTKNVLYSYQKVPLSLHQYLVNEHMCFNIRAIGNNEMCPCENARIQCPTCRSDFSTIKRSGGQMVSVNCGHIFCDNCWNGVFCFELVREKHLRRVCPVCCANVTPQAHWLKL